MRCTITAAAIVILTSLPAMAQSYRSDCQTIRYGEGDVRTFCNDIYTPAPKPFVPQSRDYGPGSREDVRVSTRQTVEPMQLRPATANHCGAGYRMGLDGCELADR